jgi:nucleoside-diphosphate-sugar epimerase
LLKSGKNTLGLFPIVFSKMVVSILGCGWYGEALGLSLVQKGINVKGSVTSAEKLGTLFSLGILPYPALFNADSESFDPGFFKCEVMVISIPPKFRQGETDAYIPKIQRIIQTILQYQIKKVIYISSTAVYGDSNSEVNELTDPQPDNPQGAILLEAEKLFQAETTFKTTIIRFGGLIGDDRDPGRFFAGKTAIPNGRAPVNLIHLQDCVGITGAVLQNNAFGYLFNACSPQHPHKADFYREASLRAGFPAPQFIDELTNWKIVSSVNLTAVLHYKFKLQNWKKYSFDHEF